MTKQIYISAILFFVFAVGLQHTAYAFSTEPFEPGAPGTFFSPGNTTPPSESSFGQIGSFQTGGVIGITPFGIGPGPGPGGGNPDTGGDGGTIDNQGAINDLPIGNGLWFLFAIAGLHLLLLYFRRKTT